jgi:hypothetical protein
MALIVAPLVNVSDNLQRTAAIHPRSGALDKQEGEQEGWMTLQKPEVSVLGQICVSSSWQNMPLAVSSAVHPQLGRKRSKQGANSAKASPATGLIRSLSSHMRRYLALHGAIVPYPATTGDLAECHVQLPRP